MSWNPKELDSEEDKEMDKHLIRISINIIYWQRRDRLRKYRLLLVFRHPYTAISLSVIGHESPFSYVHLQASQAHFHPLGTGKFRILDTILHECTSMDHGGCESGNLIPSACTMHKFVFLQPESLVWIRPETLHNTSVFRI